MGKWCSVVSLQRQCAECWGRNTEHHVDEIIPHCYGLQLSDGFDAEYFMDLFIVCPGS